MTVRALVFGIIAVCGSVSVQAQTSAPLPTGLPTELPTELSTQMPAQAVVRATGSKISAEGCVERAQRNAAVGGSETINVYQLSDATRIPRDPAANGLKTAYGLQGHEQELVGHTGHRVQITGTLANLTGDASSNAVAGGARRITVEAVTMISATCARAGAR